ncbi:Stk1 family PASTA domain-containing Ser/Thr kinase [Pseudonocardia spinosispora]|uniref:Stk1 family PASTA domain-containing Ser/Thr kinase n=1 Tax=Pseudonocardia spinosispora TaxID=103441 RepID=UPI00042806B9|nr:Stk1 family PASTA domain-containing Ser/Thr kinase [Pseudonocardia spinosispora]
MTTPRLLSERYELGDTLGYGGMSEVHKGRDVRLSRDVAVKVLRADLARDPQFQMRFRREAQNAAALNHPAIVAVYDTGEVESEFGPLPYIVMEFVEGQTLREIVKGTGPLSQQRVMEVMADVCAALDFSHRHGIIHRDVKPANIMLTTGGAVKVMDFGIARALADGQNMTQTAAVIGTAQYLSPEQARGEAVDARSDVYAAGCVLFELLTGEPPFSGDSPVAVAYQHVREDVRSPSTVNHEVPHELDAIVLKAMSKNPANRYQSSAEMRSDLVRVLRGQRPLAPQVMTEEERTALLHGGSIGGASGTGATRRQGSATGATRHAAPASWENEEQGPRSTGKMIAIGVGVVAMLAVVAFVATKIFGGPPAPDLAAVPDVTGQQQEKARETLMTSGWTVLNIKTESTTDPSKIGIVTRTDPPATQMADKDRLLTLFVAKAPDQSNMPNLIGKTVAEATPLLQGVNASVEATKYAPAPDSSKVNQIIAQDPQPGSPIKGQTKVTITIGQNTPRVLVPSMVGLTVDQATQLLKSAGLQVGSSDSSSDQLVTGSSPSSGQQVPPGTTVTLQVASGGQVPMPRLEGLSKSDARSALRDAHITASPDTSNTVVVTDPDQDDKVVRQSPVAGKPVYPDDQVQLYIGKYSSSAPPSSRNNGDNNRNDDGFGGN